MKKSAINSVFTALATIALLELSNCSTFAANANWNVDASGYWSTNSNWNPAAFPGTAPADVVGLNFPISAARSVTNDIGVTNGTLNIGSPTASGGLFYPYFLTGTKSVTFNNNGSGAVLSQTTVGGATDIISAPLVLADNFTVTNVNGLILSGTKSGTGSLTANGPGALTVSGSANGQQLYTGGTTVNGGNLIFSNTLVGGNNTAQNYTINNGATLTFNYNTGIGNNIELGANSHITGVGNLVKTGSSGVLLNNTTTVQLSGGTISVLGGYLRNENGNSGFANNQDALYVTNGAFFDIWDGNTFVDSISGGGVITKGWSSSTYTLTVGDANGSGLFSGWISNNFNGLYGGASGGTMAFTKIGTGNQVISGTNNVIGANQILGGALTITNGGAINSYNVGIGTITVGTVSNAVLNILPGSVVNANNGTSFNLGTGANGVGVVNMSGGTMVASSQIYLGSGGNGINGFAAWDMSGGTATFGSYFAIERASGTTGNNRAEFNMSGGKLSVVGNNLEIGSFQNAVSNTAVVNLSGGSTIVGTSASAGGIVYVGNGSSGVLNMSGNATLTISNTSQTLSLGGNNSGANAVMGIVNLNGGTAIVPKVVKATANTLGYFNFNGGTLQANNNSTTFMTGLTAAYVWPGGANINDGGNNITIGQSLLAPTGSGVSLGSLSASGSGFVAPPLVDISGTGTGATAIASIDGNGNVTGVTITSPGIGYTGTPTFTFTGGGSTVNQTGSATTTPNTSGGLVKMGSGTLTLSGTNNNYTGSTTVSNGTLALASPIPNSGSIIVAGGTLSLPTAGVLGSSAAVTVNAGTLNASTPQTVASLALNGGTATFTQPQTVTGSVTTADGVVLAVSAQADQTYLTSGSLILGSSTGATLQLGVVGTVNPLLASGSVTINGSLTINITNCPTTPAMYPLFSGYSSGTLVLNSQPAGRLGQLQIVGSTVFYQVTNAIVDIWTGAVSTNWDTTTLNWTNTSAGNTFTPNYAVLLDDTAFGGSSQVISVNPSSVPVGPIVVNNTVDSYTIGGAAISGGASLTKLGNNVLTLTGVNTFTGPTAISNGTVVISGAGQLAGGNYSAPVIDNGLLQYSSSAAQTLGGSITGTGVLVNNGTGALTIVGPNSYGGGTTNSSGSTLISSGGALGTGGITMNGGSIGATAALTVTNLVNVAANTTNVIGYAAEQITTFNGQLTGSGVITNFPGSAMSTAPTVYFAGDASQFAGSIIYNGANGSAYPNGNGAWWRFCNSNNMTENFSLAGLNILGGNNTGKNIGFGDGLTNVTVKLGSLSGTGDWQGSYFVTASNSSINNLLVVGYNNASTTYSGRLGISGNNMDNFDFVKVGTGTLTMTGPNPNRGVTTISGGGLGVSTLATGGGTYSNLNNTALSVTVANNNSLNMTSESFGTGDTLTFNGVSSTTVPVVNITNTVTLNGNVTVNITGGLLANQNYPLMAFGSQPGVGSFVLGSLPAGTVATLNNTGGMLYLNVTTGSTPFVWTGLNNTNWDATTSNNWKSNGVASLYADSAVVQFDDSSSQTNVNVATNVAPGPIVVANNAKNYSFSSQGGNKITGGASLIMNGTGTLTVTNLNSDFTGGTFVNAGTVVVSGPTNLGSLSGSVTLSGGAVQVMQTLSSYRKVLVGPTTGGSGSGTINVVSGQTLTLSNAVNDTVGASGTLIVTGGGTVQVSGTNNYSGGTLITNATLITFSPNDGTSFNPYGSGTVTLANGGLGATAAVTNYNAQLYIAANTTNTIGNTTNAAMTLAGTVTGSGVLQNFAGSMNNSVLLTFSGDASGFTGTFINNSQSAHGYYWRFGNAGASSDYQSYNGQNANFVLQGSGGFNWGFPDAANNYTIMMGSLSGTNGQIQAPYGATGTADQNLGNQLQVGFLPTNTVFGGQLGLSGNNCTNFSLVKVGTATLKLSGNTSLYSFGTFLQGGVLALGTNDLSPAGPLGSTWGGNGIVFQGGTLMYGPTANTDYSGRITNSTSPISIDVNGTNVTFASALSSANTGGLTLTNSTGAGKLTLTAANAYTGNTAINGGSLALSGSGSIPSANIKLGAAGTFDVSAISYTLASGVNLSGVGTVTGALATASSTATIAEGTPGTPGKLTFNNNLNLNSGATVTFNLSTSPTSGNDQILLNNAAGTLTLGPSATIQINALTGSLAAADYVLFTNAGTTTMAVPATLAFVGTQPSNYNYYTIKQIGNNVVLHYGIPGSIVTSTVYNLVDHTANAVVGQTVEIDATAQAVVGTLNNATVNLSAIGGSSSQVMTYVGGSGGVSNYTFTTTVGAGAAVGSDFVIFSAYDTAGGVGTSVSFLTNNPTTETWNGGGSDNNWSTGLNWVSTLPPGFTGDILDFTGSTQTNPNLENNYSVAGLIFDSSASSFTVGATAGKALTLAGGITNSSTVAQILNAPIVLSGPNTIEDQFSGGITLNGPVSGAGSLTNDFGAGSGGVVTLGGADSYTGNTTINGIRLIVANPAAIPSGAGVGNVNILSGGKLDLNGFNASVNGLNSDAASTVDNSSAAAVTLTEGLNNQSSTFGGIINQSGGGNLTFVKVGAGQITMNNAGANTYAGGTVISNGAIVAGNNGTFGSGAITLAGGGIGDIAAVQIPNPMTVVANTTNTFGNAAAVTGSAEFDGAVTGSGVILNFPGTTMTTTPSYYFAGDLSQFTGTFLYNSIGANGVWMRFGVLSQVSGTVVATNASFVANALGGGLDMGFPDNSQDVTLEAGSLTGNGFFQGPYGNPTGTPDHLTVGYLNRNETFSGRIGTIFNGEQNMDVIKVGTGTWTLTGASAYIGNTTVSSGTLWVTTLSTGGGGYTVADGATLGVQVVAGSLRIASLALGNSTNWYSGLSSQTLPAITCSNALTLAGPVTVNIGGAILTGQYPLIGFNTNNLTGSGGFAVGALPPSVVANIITNYVATNQAYIVLNVTSGSAPFIWTGLTSTNWDFTTANNWTSNGVSVLYGDGVIAQFDDTSSRTNVTLAATLSPQAVIVTNNTDHYSLGITNGAKLTGGTSLTKNGPGTLTLTNLIADFQGGLFINAGVVEMNNITNLGSASGNVVLSGGTLSVLRGYTNNSQNLLVGPSSGSGWGAINVAANQNLIISNVIANLGTNGTLVYSGSGTNQVYSLNTYTGGTVVSNGTVVLNVGGQTGAIRGPLTVNSNATVLVTANNGTGYGAGTRVQQAYINGGLLNTTGAGDEGWSLTYNLTGGQLMANGGASSAASTTYWVLGEDAGAACGVNTFPSAISSVISGRLQFRGDNGLTSVVFDVPAGGLSAAPDLVVSAAITQATGTVGLTKTDTGTMVLSGANSYTGTTIVSNGTLVVTGSIITGGAVVVNGGALGGTGTVSSPVTVNSGGTLGSIATTNSSPIGALSLTAGVTNNGNVYVRVNKSLAAKNDSFTVTGALTNTAAGTLTVTNIGSALAANDTFTVFSQPLPGGSAMTILPASPGAGLAWINNLAINGSIGVVALSTPILQTAPTASSITLGQSLAASVINQGSGVVTNTSGGVVSGTFSFTTPSIVPGAIGVTNVSFTFTPTLTGSYNSFTFTNGVTVVGSLTGLQFTSKPVISGTNLLISATNSGAGTIYLLSTTNLTNHLSAWVAVWTNTVGGSGNYTNTVTNVVNPAVSSQFYILSTTNNH